ncbi:MAG: hypothetical protein P4L68_08220 [Methylovirgula sp.]|nr:hypothetical protein [Methylovirgula sp.]
MSSDRILFLCDAGLKADGATGAGRRVYSPGDWPSQKATLPQIKLRILREVRQSLGRSGAPEFTTTTTIRILAEAQAYALEDNAGATAAEAAAWALKRQIEVAIINSYPLFSEIQQLASMRSDLAYTSEGDTHVAGIQMDLDFDFFEGAECFAPIATSDPTTIRIDPTNYAPASIDIDVRGPLASS